MAAIHAGTILRDTLQVFGSKWLLLIGLSGLLFVPHLVAWAICYLVAEAGLYWPLVSGGLSLLFPFLAAGAVVVAVTETHSHRAPGLRDCLRAVGARFFPLLGLGLAIRIVSGLGFIFCVIPGAVIYTGLFVAVPALLVEGVSVGSAWNRSWSLTRDYKLSIFATVIVLYVAIYFVAFVGGAVFGLAGSALVDDQPGTTDFLALFDSPDFAVGAVHLFQIFIESLSTAVVATAAAVTYRQLRAFKEDYLEEEMLAVFD